MLPLISLWLLVFLTLLLVVTIFMHLWLRVPYVPTPRRVIEEAILMAKIEGKETVFDLGAGDGRVLLTLVRRFPQITAIGCELVPTIWLLAVIRRFLSGKRYVLHLRAAEEEDVRSADVVFVYLFPHLLSALTAKFDRELRPGTRVISHTFRFPGREPVEEKRVRGIAGETSLLLYRW